MKVKFGQVIPKGLALAITTWENGDTRLLCYDDNRVTQYY